MLDNVPNKRRFLWLHNPRRPQWRGRILATVVGLLISWGGIFLAIAPSTALPKPALSPVQSLAIAQLPDDSGNSSGGDAENFDEELYDESYGDESYDGYFSEDYTYAYLSILANATSDDWSVGDRGDMASGQIDSSVVTLSLELPLDQILGVPAASENPTTEEVAQVEAYLRPFQEDLLGVVGCPTDPQADDLYSEIFGGWLSFSMSCEISLVQEQSQYVYHLDLAALKSALQVFQLNEIGLSVYGLPSQPIIVTPNLPEEQVFWSRDYYSASLFLPEINDSTLTVRMGYSQSAVLWRVAGAIALLWVPICITYAMRRRVLKLNLEDPAPVWFGYQRWLGWITTALWLAWLSLAFSFDTLSVFSSQIVEPFLGSGAGAAEWGENLSFLIPPVLVNTLCYVISYPVFVRVGRMEWSRIDLAQQALWSQLHLLLPVVIGVAGVRSLATANLRWGLVLIVLAVVSRLILVQLFLKSQDLTIQALTSGELRDRIFDLAKLAGVTLNQVYVVPNRRNKMVNAFAMQNGNLMFTQFLLERLTKPEVDAVVAHELAHLQYKHHNSLATTLLTSLIGLGILTYFLSYAWLPWLPWFPITVCLGLLIYYFNSRRYEHQADLQAVLLTQTPNAMITALVKLAKLNLMPLEWGKREELWLTHPSMRQRAEAIASRYDIPVNQLEQLFDDSAHAQDFYQLPPVTVQAEPIFSTQVKQYNIGWISLMLSMTMAAVPVMTAVAIQGLAVGAGLRWLLMLAGAIATGAAVLWVLNWAALFGHRRLTQRMAQHLSDQGFSLQDWNGTLVGLSPDDQARIYEGFYNWDLGAVFLLGDRLCYVGEQTRFALPKSHIVKIQRCPGVAGFWRSPRIGIYWHDPQQNTSGVFSLAPAQVRSLRGLAQTTRRYQHHLDAWYAKPTPTSPLPDAFADFPRPTPGNVTSKTLAEVLTVSQMLNHSVTVMTIAIALSLWARLPLEFQQGGTLYALAAVIPGLLVYYLPLWRDRRPKADPT